MYRMILYSEEIWSAFGDPPDLGTRKLAEATGASISDTATETPSSMVKVTDQRGARRRRGCVGSARKARAILPAPRSPPSRHEGLAPAPARLVRDPPPAGRPTRL